MTEDMIIIKENLAFLEKLQPVIAAKAFRVLAELGYHEIPSLKPEQITTIAELISFHQQQFGYDPEIDTIRQWKNMVSAGISIKRIVETLSMTAHDSGMDI